MRLYSGITRERLVEGVPEAELTESDEPYPELLEKVSTDSRLRLEETEARRLGASGSDDKRLCPDSEGRMPGASSSNPKPVSGGIVLVRLDRLSILTLMAARELVWELAVLPLSRVRRDTSCT